MSSRNQHGIKTTKDMVSVVSCVVAITSNASGSIIACTDQSMVTGTVGSGVTIPQITYLSGTSPGLYTVAFPAENRYPQTLGYHISLHTPNAVDAARYTATIFSGSGEGFKFRITSGTLGTGEQLANPTTAQALSASITMYVRNTNRGV